MINPYVWNNQKTPSMFKRHCCIVLVLLLSLPVLAQRSLEKGPKPKIVEPVQVRFNLFSPGIDFEIGLFKNQTIFGGLGLGFAYYEEGYAFGLALNTEYRFYYNLKKRIRQNKVIAGNSGNYIGAARAIFFDPLVFATDIPGEDFNIGYYGALYGIQRTFKKGLNIDVSTGVGYYRGDGALSGLGPILNLMIGWVATKRKSKGIYHK